MTEIIQIPHRVGIKIILLASILLNFIFYLVNFPGEKITQLENDELIFRTRPSSKIYDYIGLRGPTCNRKQTFFLARGLINDLVRHSNATCPATSNHGQHSLLSIPGSKRRVQRDNRPPYTPLPWNNSLPIVTTASAPREKLIREHDERYILLSGGGDDGGPGLLN